MGTASEYRKMMVQAKIEPAHPKLATLIRTTIDRSAAAAAAAGSTRLATEEGLRHSLGASLNSPRQLLQLVRLLESVSKAFARLRQRVFGLGNLRTHRGKQLLCRGTDVSFGSTPGSSLGIHSRLYGGPGGCQRAKHGRLGASQRVLESHTGC